MDVSFSFLTRITHTAREDVWPAWSPDGTRIAFESYLDGKSEVYVVNSDGSGLARLTKSPAR